MGVTKLPILFLLFFTELIFCHSCMNAANLTDIHIIGFFPCTDPNDTRGIPVDNCDGIERIPIMKLALEEINERCDLLPGYRLVVDYANSAVSLVVVLVKSCGVYTCMHACRVSTIQAIAICRLATYDNAWT